MNNTNSNNSKFEKTFKHLLNYKLWVPTYYKTLLLGTIFIVS